MTKPETAAACLQVKAVMRFGDLSGTPDMLCSSIFDRDDEFFATAGVSRKIKVRCLLLAQPARPSSCGNVWSSIWLVDLQARNALLTSVRE